MDARLTVISSDGNTRLNGIHQIEFDGSVTSKKGGTAVLSPNVAVSPGFYVDYPPYNAPSGGVLDATSAIQQAIDDAEAVNGTVYFGHKTYKVTGLFLSGNVTLQGAGDSATILYSTTDAPIISMEAVDFELPKIYDLKIKGSTSGTNQIGLKVDDPVLYGLRGVFKNIWITDCGSHGLYVKRAFSCLFENIFSTNNNGYPIYYDGANMPANLFVSCYPGDVLTGAEVGFKIISGQLVLYRCNGINGGAGLGRSKWAEVGTSISGARLDLVDCNVESFGYAGILAHHSSMVSVIGDTSFACHGESDTVTISIASPAVVTWNAHPMENGDAFEFITTGALPTGLTVGTKYYVINKSTNTFQLSATKSGSAINTSGTQSGVHKLTKYAKAIYFKLENDGVDFYSPFLTRGYISDTVDFANGASAFAEGYPVHANGMLPMQLQGQGALQGGSPNAKLSNYFNTVSNRADLISRADGNVVIDTITADKVYNYPGIRYIALNHSSPITVTLPWPGWYARAQEIIVIADVSTSGCATNNVTVQSGGGGNIDGGSVTMNINKQAIMLVPDGNSSYKIISSWKEYKFITEAGGGVTISGFLQTDDLYARNYSNSASAAPSINIRRHCGTESSPTKVLSGYALGYNVWQGQYDTTDGHRHSAAYLTVSATEDFSSTQAGVKIVLSGANNGSTNGFAKAITLLDPSNGGGSIYPNVDNAQDCGRSSFRWANVYGVALNCTTLLASFGTYINGLLALSQASSILEVGSGFTSNGVKILGGGSNHLRVDGNGNIRLGAGGGLSTSDTDKFPYIPGCSGTPVGTPTSVSGMYPMVYDSSANKLWIYNGSWRGVALT